ncbi:MAG: PHP domain-containing protein [Candidatus Methylomirabilia bacterium]
MNNEDDCSGRPLLCDFHIHTRFSDGALDLAAVVDLFGQAGFDAISITDHVSTRETAIGWVARGLRLSLTERTFENYLAHVRAEAARALERYGMLVIPGVEITKDYLNSDLSAHLLLVDIKEYVSASWSYERIFEAARAQDALVIACHPHHMSARTDRNTLYFWNNRERFAPHIDAWEIANRDDVFGVVGLKKYPYVASSDFHRPRHLYSWKTLLSCGRSAGDIKRCLRENRGVAITLFRN